MRRIFSVFAVIMASLILFASGGIYWYSSNAIFNSYKSATTEVAQGLASEITAQLDFLQESTDGLARNVDVIAALSNGNPTIIRNTEDKLQTLIPYSLRVRLLLPTISEPEQTQLPHMGFGDLEMVRSTLTNPQSPVIQGENEHRHLAFSSAVVRDQQVIGVVLVSIKPNLVQQIISKSKFAYGYLDVKQGDVLLAGHGAIPEDKDDMESMVLANGRWKLNYISSSHHSAVDIIVVVALISIPCILAFIALFLGYRKLSGDLKQDQSSILKATKDMLLGKKLGSYPMQIDEMSPLINTLAQFKRVIELESVVPQTNVAGNYVFDESFDLDFDDLTPTSTRDDSFSNTQISAPIEPIRRTEIVVDIGPTLSEVSPTIAEVGPTLAETSITAVKPKNKHKGAKRSSSERPESFAADNYGIEIKEITSKIPDSWDMDASIQPTKVADKRHLPIEIAPTAMRQVEEVVNDGVFGRYDILGIAEQNLTASLVSQIGQAFASEARQRGVRTVVVGRDGRLSSPALAEAVVLGLNASGCDVLDIGLVPIPLFYFVTQHNEGRCGVMVTGSHNAAEFNGLKLVLNGEVLGGESLKSIEERIEQQNFLDDGTHGSHEQNAAFVDEYIGMIADETNSTRPLTLVIDAGNGVTGNIAPELFKAMGCEVISLNCEIDGHFPNHQPDPSKPENLQALIQAVKQHQADLGVAFDGDGDRIGLVDSLGNIVSPDRLMMLFARDVLAAKPGAEILYDVKCSKHLAEQIAKRGGRGTMLRTGSTSMRAKLKESGAALAGELSGHIFFNDRWFGFDDALYAAARAIEIISADMRSSADLFAELPDGVNTPELLVPVNAAEKAILIEQLLTLTDQFKDANLITLDGLRAEFNDGWGLVRASNSSSALSIRFEADSLQALARIQERFKTVLHQIKPDLTLPF